MKYAAIPCVALLLSLLSSCEKVIEAGDLPQQEPMLVINCLLYPDSLVQLNTSSSKSVLSGKDYKYVANAVCELYEDGAYMATANTGTNGNCTFPVTAKINKKYTIKAGATGFKSVSATTSIPGTIAVTPVERYDTAQFRYDFYQYGPGSSINGFGGSAKFRLSILDDISMRNYYSIRAVVFAYDGNGVKTAAPAGISSNVDDLTDNNGFTGLAVDFNDQTLVNGKEVVVDVNVAFNHQLSNGATIQRVEVFLEIYSLSEDYYKYQQTLLNQASTGASFFAEPVLVYTNISNGAGILAGTYIQRVKVYPQ